MWLTQTLSIPSWLSSSVVSWSRDLIDTIGAQCEWVWIYILYISRRSCCRKSSRSSSNSRSSISNSSSSRCILLFIKFVLLSSWWAFLYQILITNLCDKELRQYGSLSDILYQSEAKGGYSCRNTYIWPLHCNCIQCS